MGVQTEHSQYVQRKKLRQMIRDCLGGSNRIKYRGEVYLPIPEMCKDSRSDGYYRYLKRAYYVNLASRTVRALSGLVMRKKAIVNVAGGLEYLINDTDGNGTTLQQSLSFALDEVVSMGNVGILSTMPLANDVNKQNQSDYLPRMHLFKEEQIINWRVKSGKLTLLVLLDIEEDGKDSDIFETVIKPIFRVYLINGAGKLEERIYRSIDGQSRFLNYYADDYASGVITSSGNFDITTTVYDSRDLIPFTFIGAVDNSPGFDISPIENICDFSLALYQLSADEMLNAHNASGGVLAFTSDLTMDEFQEFNGSTDINVNFGALHLGRSGDMKYVQASESKMIGSTMERILDLAVAQGAQIISPKYGEKTATEARIDQGSNTSQLAQIAQNISQAFTSHINLMASWINTPDDNKIELNEEFFSEKMSADEIRAWSEAVLKGTATRLDMIHDMKAGGRIQEDRSVEEIEGELSEAALDAGFIDG